MPNALALIRSLLIYGLCLPLAIVLGYLLATPKDPKTFTFIVGAVCLPLLPILLRWHHFLLVASWNVAAILFFVPGRPDLWIVMSLVSLVLTVLHHILNREKKLISVPSVSRPLLFLVLVLVGTGMLTGGLGLRSFGSDVYGSKRYIYVFFAILGYFAISANRIPRGHETVYVSAFLLGAVSSVFGSLASLFPIPPSFYFIFYIFPPENLEAFTNELSEDAPSRLGGLGTAAAAVAWYCLARYGLRNLFRLTEPWGFLPFRKQGFLLNQPWRAIFVLIALWLGLQGGFRSSLLFFGAIFLCYFFVEKLHRSMALPFLAIVLVLLTVVGLSMPSKLPPNVQRTISFLPLDIDPVIRMGAEASTEWRIRMWKNVLPLVPRYLFLGKGYAINPAELSMAQARMGADSTDAAIIAGDYHSGPLTLLIPLGIWGAIGFLWFLFAGFRVLYRNYRYGDPNLQHLNTFLLIFFCVQTLFYFFVFGSFYSDLCKFTGIVALSISINGTAPEAATVPAPRPTLRPLRLARAGP